MKIVRDCFKCCLLLYVLVFGSLGASIADVSILGGNVIPNGGFEERTAEGLPLAWTSQTNGGDLASDTEYFAEGSRSARMTLRQAPGSVQLLSTPAPANPGYYLVRFMFRVAGLSKSQAYEGGQADVQISWLGEGGKVLSKDYVAWSYFPMEWSYRDRFYTAPPETTAVRLALGIGGNPPVQIPSAAWFDDVAVCPYHPPTGIGEKVTKEWSVTAGQELLKVPDAPAWFYLSGKEGSESTQAERVRDGDAFLGWSLHAKPGVPNGIVFHSPYTVEQPPGLYRVYYRLKAPRTPPPKPEEAIVSVDVDSSDCGPRGARSLRQGDFATPGQYEEVWFDVVKRTSGWLSFRVWTPGGQAEYWLDHVRVVQLRRFTDPDLLAWYPGVAGSLGPKPSLERAIQPRLLLVKGLLGDTYRVEEAALRWTGCQITVVPYALGQGGPSVTGYPLLWKDLRKYDAVVFANASVASLGPEQRFQLVEFVRNGGGLFLLGGKAAYGNGGLRGSFLEGALPIQVTEDRFDLQTVSGNLVKTSAVAVGNPKRQGDLICPAVHRTKLKSGATASLTVGKSPALASASFGKGRVACFTGAPYGESAEGKTLFSEWKDWPLLMRNVLQWVAGR
ncbi:MAG: hypothetical protein HY318_08100 [Armatimonadetes bacterium]|nr:hypothetical protein [Armatimonadota bacterium]